MTLRRIILGVVLLASSGLAGYAQQQFIQTVAKDNKNCNAVCSVIDIPELNGNPSAVIFVTPVGNTASLNPHPIGLYFMYLKKWSVFNLDGIAIPEGAKYTIEYYAQPDANHFTFLVRQGGGTCIDRDGLNGNSSAQVRVFPAGSPTRGSWYNDSPVVIEYNATRLKWCLKSIGGGGVKTDTAYNIAFSGGGGAVPLAGTRTNSSSASTIQTTSPTPLDTSVLQTNTTVLPIPMSTLTPAAPGPPAALMVVARDVLPLPSVNLGMWDPATQHVGWNCAFALYTNPDIRITDTVLVTDQRGSGQELLSFSVGATNGSVTMGVCTMPGGTAQLAGRKINILVLR